MLILFHIILDDILPLYPMKMFKVFGAKIADMFKAALKR